MNAKITFTIDSIFAFVLSITMIFFHDFMLSTFGLSNSPTVAEIHLSRTLGFALFGLSVIMWGLRDNPLRLAIVGFSLFFTMDIINIILEISNGMLNNLAWIMVILIGVVVALNVWTGWALYQSD